MAKLGGRVLYVYDGCGTCKKARRWLDERKLAYEAVPIVERPPTERELRAWMRASGLPARKWLNTSGQSYRALVATLGKPRVASLDDAEIVALLAKDGKLVKRPVLIVGETVLVGFDEAAYAARVR